MAGLHGLSRGMDGAERRLAVARAEAHEPDASRLRLGFLESLDECLKPRRGSCPVRREDHIEDKSYRETRRKPLLHNPEILAPLIITAALDTHGTNARCVAQVLGLRATMWTCLELN